MKRLSLTFILVNITLISALSLTSCSATRKKKKCPDCPTWGKIEKAEAIPSKRV